MELREWLFLVGALIILAVVVDAIRRARLASRDSVEMSRSMGVEDLSASPLDVDFNPELPNGGFRTIRRPEDDDLLADEPMSAHAMASEDSRLENDMRADSPDTALSPDNGDSGLHAEPADAPKPAYRVVPGGKVGERAGRSRTRDDFKERFLKRIGAGEAAESAGRESLTQSDVASRPVEQKARAPRTGSKQELLVINVLSKDGKGFDGGKLRQLVEACGLELGKMHIFHRHEHGFHQGPVQFSMANAMEPGTFAPGFEDELIQGVCFFMQLPGPEDSMLAFDYMLETAQCLVRNLGGELRDECQSVINGQTVEHCRQRIREFERRQLSARV